MLSKSLIQFSVDGRGCVSSPLFDPRPNYGGNNEDNGTSLRRSHGGTAALSAPTLQQPPSPTPPPETPGHSWASLGQSLAGSLLLSPGSWYTQGSVCALQESVSPVLCKFWRLYGGVTGDLLQEGLCHAQVCCAPGPCPCGRPLLTRTSSGDTHTQLWLSLCGASGSWCTQGMFDPSECLWRVRGLIPNVKVTISLQL